MLLDYRVLISNVSFQTIALLLTVIALVIAYYALKDYGLPPGPTGLPYFGYLPFLKHGSVHLQLQRVHEKYGDICSFRVLGKVFISMGSTKALRESTVAKSECFSARFEDFCFLTYILGGGVGFLNGEQWKVLRKYFVQVFKEFGLTSSLKEHHAGPVHDILNTTIDELKTSNGAPINVSDLFEEKCTDIMHRLLFNEVGISRQELKELIQAYGNTLKVMSSYNLLLFGNFAKYFIVPLIPGTSHLQDDIKTMENILYKALKEHKEVFDENHVRDVFDDYIKERNIKLRRGDPSADSMTDEALVSSLIQIIGDGTLTVATTIGVFLQALVQHPNKQEKIHSELLEVVGPDRQPTLADRNKLPYLNAFLMEVVRTTDFFPIFPSLECTKETSLRGYKIPKGAISVINMWAANHDPNVFEEPFTFNPDRYVAFPGKQKPELPLLFGIGKRACIGEAYTMMQVFLFVSTIVKNFHLTLPGDGFEKNKLLITDWKMEICAVPRSIH